MILSCILFGYLIGVVEGIVQNYTAMNTKFRDICVGLNVFMKKHKVPLKLRFKVKRYMEYTSIIQQKSEIEESEMLEFLSIDLRELVCIYSRGHIFKNLIAFSQFDKLFLKKITLIVCFNCYAPGDVIFEDREKTRDIYFIQEGDISLEDTETGCVIKKLVKLSYFGEIAFFVGSPRICKAFSVSYSETLTIL